MTLLDRLWSWLVNALAIFGGASLCAVIWFHAVLWYEAHADRPRAALAPPSSPAAVKIAGWLVPPLQSYARDNEASFVAGIDGMVARWTVRQAYPRAVDAIPGATVVGVEALLTRLCEMPASDVAAAIVEHADATGVPLHRSHRKLLGR